MALEATDKETDEGATDDMSLLSADLEESKKSQDF